MKPIFPRGKTKQVSVKYFRIERKSHPTTISQGETTRHFLQNIGLPPDGFVVGRGYDRIFDEDEDFYDAVAEGDVLGICRKPTTEDLN